MEIKAKIKTIKDFLEYLRYMNWEDITEEKMLVQMGGNRTRYRLVWFVLNMLEGYFAAFMCWANGHKWEDCSSIGPESGVEAHSCIRCGSYFSHIYY